MKKFSKGPWNFWNNAHPSKEQFNHVTPDDDSDGIGWYSKSLNICDANDNIVAEVKAMTVGSFLHSFKEWEANCHLILSAPEMYDALKDMVSVYEKYTEGVIYSDHKYLLKAKAALSAASPSIHVKKEDNE